MAPIKFEENIKEKLEKRTLQPSDQAWNTLSEKLEADTKKTSNKTFWWLGIAASLVGVLVMVNVFFKTTETNNQTPVLVDAETKEVQSVQNLKVIDTDHILVAIEESKVAIEKTSESKKPSNKNKATVLKNNQIDANSLTQVENNEEPEKIIDNSISETPSTKTTIAQLETQENTSKTNTDINALLLEAQQKISKTATSKTYSIDANALLQDVEEDLDESFRDRVYETIKTNYKKVKTAVAERND